MTTKKVGRPLSDKPKDITVRARMDSDTVKKLDECVEHYQSNRSEIIRRGVNKIHQEIKE